jgi:hypothetical protein
MPRRDITDPYFWKIYVTNVSELDMDFMQAFNSILTYQLWFYRTGKKGYNGIFYEEHDWFIIMTQKDDFGELTLDQFKEKLGLLFGSYIISVKPIGNTQQYEFLYETANDSYVWINRILDRLDHLVCIFVFIWILLCLCF